MFYYYIPNYKENVHNLKECPMIVPENPFKKGGFKTELCHQFQEFGDCKYGNCCRFAHGTHELQPLVNRHPKFRTKICLAYEEGYCSFGVRCSFIHKKCDPFSILESFNNSPKNPIPFNSKGGDSIDYDDVIMGDLSMKNKCKNIIDEYEMISPFVLSNYKRLPVFTKFAY